jgi:hypothetical protein
MPSQVLHESKHIIKRVFIGVATGVLGAAIIYFLGYTRNPSRASEIEIKKNTSNAWKAYVTIENNAWVNWDSNSAQLNRSLIAFKAKYRLKDSTYREYLWQDSLLLVHKDSPFKERRRQDSLISVQFMGDLEELRQTKDIDKDFLILLGTRIAYLKEQLEISTEYKKKIASLILEPGTGDYEKTYEKIELNKLNTTRRENITERIGRSIEDLAGSLSKKYEYPFSLTDFKFYPYYISLKKSKNQPAKPGVAPSDPNKSGPVLPD